MRVSTGILALSTLLTGFLKLSQLSAEVDSAPGRIDSVTIYKDRATVRRIREISPFQGTRTIRFTGLPAAMAADSVRATGTGFQIISISVRNGAPEEEPEHPLRARIKSLETDIRSESDRQLNFREQLKVLASMGQISGSERDRRPDVNLAAWADTLRFLEKTRMDYLEKIQRSEERITSLKKELGAASEQWNRILQSQKRSSQEIDVVMTSSGSGGTAALDYTVSGVSWNGIYDLHGSSEGGDFRLESRASVRQSTGEDWKGVQLTLSTARPQQGMSPGALSPWRISGSNLWTMDRETGRNEAGEETSTGTRGDSSDSASAVFVLPARESIPSDNSEHRLTLQTSTLKGTVTHVAVPSLTSAVYLRAAFKNTSSMPLVWGRMNIFLDGGFAGSAPPPGAAAGEEFEMYLGQDQRMSAKRVLLRGDVTGTGILSSKVQIQNQWQIEIANHGKKSVQVVVYDRYPIARDPNISTKFLGSSRTDLKPDPNGILVSTLNVAPAKSEKFDFGYSLEVTQEVWQRLQDALDREKGRAPAAPSEVSPAKQRMYNLDEMLMH